VGVGGMVVSGYQTQWPELDELRRRRTSEVVPCAALDNIGEPSPYEPGSQAKAARLKDTSERSRR
jgi:hypothetical protein